MKSYYLGSIFFISTALCATASDVLPASVADAFSSYAALPGKLVPHLQKAKDKASADAAAEDLRQALTEVYATREKLHNIPQLTPEQNQAVRRTYEKQMRTGWGGVYKEIDRLKKNRCYQSAEFADIFHLMCMMIEK